jgi:hypothetical protein
MGECGELGVGVCMLCSYFSDSFKDFTGQDRLFIIKLIVS